jgi:excisionase family DNA binding protein
MPRMKKRRNPTRPPVSSAAGGNGLLGEVLTLPEVAAYLRLNEAEVRRLIAEQQLPGRQLGPEWRFLKAAIQDWLRGGPSPVPSKAAQLAVVGSWKDDPYVEEELSEIYRQRGRPMAEEHG